MMKMKKSTETDRLDMRRASRLGRTWRLLDALDARRLHAQSLRRKNVSGNGESPGSHRETACQRPERQIGTGIGGIDPFRLLDSDTMRLAAPYVDYGYEPKYACLRLDDRAVLNDGTVIVHNETLEAVRIWRPRVENGKVEWTCRFIAADKSLIPQYCQTGKD
jgi:hypothetical protein